MLLILAIAIVLWLIWPRPFGGPTVKYTAYFPGQTTIKAKTRLVFGRTRVGRVGSVVASEEGMQLTVVPVLAPAVPEVATLLLGSRADLTVDSGHTASITLEDRSHAVIRWDTATILAARTDSGEWTLTSGVQVPPVSLDGRPILPPGAGKPASLHSGDCLVFGTALRVCWGEVDFLTRVEVHVRQGRFAGEAKSTGDTAGTISPGTSVALLSGFGHPRPELELRPSLYHGAPRVTVSPRPPPGKGDSVGAFELTPVVSIDPLALLSSVTTYLGTPAGMRQPASNRIERDIEHVSVVTKNLAELAQQLNHSGKGEDPGVLLRLALNEQQARSLSAALAYLESASGTANAELRSLQPTLASAGGAVENFNRLSAQLVKDTARIDSTLRNVHRLTGVLAQNTGRIDSTLRSVNRVTGVLASNDSTINTTLHNVESITTGVKNAGPRIESTAAGVQRAVRKAKIPVLVVVGTWLLGRVRSIVR
ncbi:MAG: hypothetical protein ACJ8GN_12980 [Longimicrobiaceae bacterium]